ncbi:MAG: cyclase family protein [Steroidobacteraceae bacterium]
MKYVTLERGDSRVRADLSRPIDISIPLDFAGPQPSHFGAPAATANAMRSGDFVGDVRLGGSCNCEEYRLTAHCNGTHTEGVGHVTRERVSIHLLANGGPEIALLLSVDPVPAGETNETAEPTPKRGDQLVTARAIAAAWERWRAPTPAALVLRTLPNDFTKRSRVYGAAEPPPYLSRAAVELIVAQGIEHLLLDLPSLDRSHDEGLMSGHRLFWGLPPGSHSVAQARRPRATVTEMVFVPDDVADGFYLLDLQLAPFVADATPSRPLLFPVVAS